MCPWVDLVWFGSPLGLKIDKQSYTTLDTWLLQVIKNFSSKKDRQWALTLVCFFIWSIWKARCRFVYQHIPVSPTIVIQLGWEAASEFKTSTKPTTESPMFEQVLNWNPPPMDMIAINCDGSWDKSGLGGKCVVIRNHMCSFMGGLATPIRGSSVEAMEALAILAGVSLAVDMNLKAVQVQSDSQSVILDLNSLATCNN